MAMIIACSAVEADAAPAVKGSTTHTRHIQDDDEFYIMIKVMLRSLSQLKMIRLRHLLGRGNAEQQKNMVNVFRNLDLAKLYASNRPTYPPELFQFISSKAPGRKLAWDVGTGCGQAAVSLSEFFDSVVATDCSPEQISQAPAHLSNVRFAVTPATFSVTDLHRLVAPPGSVDLITVAMALQWFDIPAFFELAKAVLRRPGGVLAVWCYDNRLTVDGGGTVNEIYGRLAEEMRGYIDRNVRDLVDEGYAGLEFPFEGVEGVEKGTGPVKRFVAEKVMGVDGLIALTKTWATYRMAREEGVELLTNEVVDDLKRAWGEDGRELKTVKFPLSLRIGRI